MHDEVLLKSHRKLTKLKASVDHILGLRPFQGTYESGNIDEKVLMSMMGRTRIPFRDNLFQNFFWFGLTTFEKKPSKSMVKIGKNQKY